MLEFRNVSFSYNGDSWVLRDINFSVEKGEFVSIIGSNGSGKSTIARLSNGLLLSQKGEVFLDGNSLKDIDINRMAKFKVGVVFQNPDNQFVGITVEDDLAFGLENMGLERNQIQMKILEISEKLGIKSFLHFPPSLLSGGEKQKVAIASVLILEPDYIIFDEVTSLLDPINRKMILKTIREISVGKGVLYITHHPEETVFSDRIIVLNEGYIVKTGTPYEVFGDVDFLASVNVSNLNEAIFSKKLLESGLIERFSLNLEEIVSELCLN
ncbi:ATP-binding cassette domain-containing protein [Caldisericum exile]|uniref:Cobalt ABC transporter ATP-binding protein n=1 Tax=Caldisericum exile (strain DSM 21853 / NBRC 104410 / AZM16c01) TaxID=511051 RepID=A0A7U6GF45_CALEA|nr:ATP-binding cassette domain-containing protein [Caldisericum exile]BAL81238.1 putative cobalt ABC transporter ATP-binding protein [Caldisericum exile AZM16c01]